MMTPTNLWNAFNETVDRRGDAAAFICGDRTWTFADWRRRTDVYRAAFRSHGVERHDRVLLWVENDFEIAAAITAAWASEAIPALLDSGSRAPQLDNALRTARPRVLVRLADSALPLPDIAVAQVVAEPGRRTSARRRFRVSAHGTHRPRPSPTTRSASARRSSSTARPCWLACLRSTRT
jgi:acyl-CoA synthetase (AMP-forming)/AMP-acid ligase II